MGTGGSRPDWTASKQGFRTSARPLHARVKVTGYDEDRYLIGLELEVNLDTGQVEEVGPE